LYYPSFDDQLHWVGVERDSLAIILSSINTFLVGGTPQWEGRCSDTGRLGGDTVPQDSFVEVDNLEEDIVVEEDIDLEEDIDFEVDIDWNDYHF
jgi:hypothetical protein